MLHYKAFSSAATGDDLAALETAVNTWLEETQPLVHTMTQSAAEAGVVVSFLYEMEDERDERLAVATAEASLEGSLPHAQLTTNDTLMLTLLPQMELPY